MPERTARVVVWGIATALLAFGGVACTVENSAHCGNNGGHAACHDPDAPWCDLCVAANDGCVAGNVGSGKPECLPPQTSTSTSSTTGDSTTTSSTSAGSSGSGESGDSAESSTGTPAVCGDGVVQDDERCDPPDYAGFDCQTVGLGGGELGCSPDCASFDLEGCEARPECGNGTREGNEPCDGEDIGTANCAMLPTFISGSLTCTEDCTFDTSQCVPCHAPTESCASDAECCSGVCNGVLIGELLGTCA